jgi:hypothetical protein
MQAWGALRVTGIVRNGASPMGREINPAGVRQAIPSMKSLVTRPSGLSFVSRQRSPRASSNNWSTS